MWEVYRQWAWVACREVMENRELGDRSGRVAPAEHPLFSRLMPHPWKCPSLDVALSNLV